MAQEISSLAFPTDLTIRLHHIKSSFTATFKTRLSLGKIHKTKCSCSRLSRLWPGSDRLEDVSSRKHLLPETPHKTTVLTFIFRSAENKQKATDICSGVQKTPDSEPFRIRMFKMLTALAAVCEAEHLSGRSNPQPTIRIPLRPFRKNNLDRKSVSEEVRAKMLSPLTPSALQGQGLGYIYILRSPMDLSTLSVLKIGFSKYHPEHRAHELASCIPVTEVVAHTPLLPHAMRVEALIHAELADRRKILACGQCGHDHREWFEISHAESREVVVKWSRWILYEPYLKGNLSDEWRAYLQEKDFRNADPETTISRQWMEILGNFPRTVSDISQQTQLATYVNNCYLEDLSHRVLGLKTGSWANIRQALQRSRGGGPLDIENFMMWLDDFGPVLSEFLALFNVESIGDDEQQSLEELQDIEVREAELFEQMEYLKSIKTGSKSVDDPLLGKTESPMGDATLLPVVSLEAVRQMDPPVRSWFGYTPTHGGFQFLQEAYHRGEWIGNCPQFRLPKAFREADPKKDGRPQKSTGKTVQVHNEKIALTSG